jgi:hypothetical protein
MEETVRDAGADNVIPYRTRRGALGKTAFDLSPKTSQQGGIESANYPWRTMTWSAQIVHYNRGAKFKKQDQNNSRRRHESGRCSLIPRQPVPEEVIEGEQVFGGSSRRWCAPCTHVGGRGNSCPATPPRLGLVLGWGMPMPMPMEPCSRIPGQMAGGEWSI